MSFPLWGPCFIYELRVISGSSSGNNIVIVIIRGTLATEIQTSEDLG